MTNAIPPPILRAGVASSKTNSASSDELLLIVPKNFLRTAGLVENTLSQKVYKHHAQTTIGKRHFLILARIINNPIYYRTFRL